MDFRDQYITYFDNCKAISADYVSLVSAFEDIRRGRWYSEITAIRKASNKQARSVLKQSTLPAFVFQGLFGGRGADSLLESSGLRCLDFDNCDITAKELIKCLPYVMACFISPSGNGLKVIVRSFASWECISEAFSFWGLNVDESGKDISRLCFASYDPDIYINYDADELIEVLPTVESEPADAATDKPLEWYQEVDAIRRITACFGVPGDGERHAARLRVGKLAGGFVSTGLISESTAWDTLSRLSDSVADGGTTSKTEVRALLDSYRSGLSVPVPTTANEPVRFVSWQDTLDSTITAMNEVFSLVTIGGDVRIMEGENIFYKRHGFITMFENQIIQVGEKEDKNSLTGTKPIMMDIGTAWIKHPKRRTYTGGLVFDPTNQHSENQYNTWKGFPVEPVKGDWSLLKYHIDEIICAGDKESQDYLYKWLARGFQMPEKQAGSAIVMRGEEGSGKGVFGHFIRKLWNGHGMHISSSSALVGHFNGHLANKCFLFADEAFFHGDKKNEGHLKSMITEEVIDIERKGLDKVSQPNYLKIIMSTNQEYAVNAATKERRYCVLDVDSRHIDDNDYFDALIAHCDSDDVRSAFLFDMLTLDVRQFHPNKIPQTQGLKDQRTGALDSIGQFLVDFTSDDIEPVDWISYISGNELYLKYINWCSRNRISNYDQKTKDNFCKKVHGIFTRTRRDNIRYYKLDNFLTAKQDIRAFYKI